MSACCISCQGVYNEGMRKILLSVTALLLAGCCGTSHDAVTDERIEVAIPIVGQSITSPLEVSGKARGQWFFEATAPISIVDWDGKIIAQSYIQAKDNWMTEDFVNFEGTIEFEIPADSPSRKGAVIFQRSNPSDLPENAAAVEIPVVFE